MNTTDNYNMNLPEGTDTVNLLTDYNPNFETIDAEMYGNSIHGVGTATELKSGTVHALTRDNADTAVFRYVATANWTSGDQVTVDGVSVTALTPSGESLADNAYVINANVLCILTGTLCTFFVGAGTVAEALDSQRLGGELPSYYGKDSDVTAAVNTANAAGTLATNANNEITAFKEFTGKVLWQGNFTTGNITVPDANKYKLFAFYLADGVWCFGTLGFGAGGIGAYGSYAIQQYAYRVDYSVSGDDATLTINATSKGGTNGSSQVAIQKIVGLAVWD